MNRFVSFIFVFLFFFFWPSFDYRCVFLLVYRDNGGGISVIVDRLAISSAYVAISNVFGLKGISDVNTVDFA